MTALEIATVFQALHEGKELECRTEINRKWGPLKPALIATVVSYINGGIEVRVKPTPREWQLCATHEIVPRNANEKRCYAEHVSNCRIITVREVVE